MSMAKSPKGKGSGGKSGQAGRHGTGKTGKKSKSLGFIESAEFKPGWLETGPLTPDMLENVGPAHDPAQENLTEEYEARLAELNKFYEQALEAGPASEPASAESVSDAAPLETPEEAAPEAATFNEQPSDSVLTPTPSSPEVIELMATAPEPGEGEALPDDDASPPDDSIPSPIFPAAPETTPSPALPPVDFEAIDQPPDDRQPETDVFRLDEPEMPAGEAATVEESAAVVMPAAAPVAQRPKRRSRKANAAKTGPARPRYFDRPARLLLLVGLLLWSLAAFIFFVNPFARLALARSELAEPVAADAAGRPSQTAAGAQAQWCLAGDLGDGRTTALMDNGRQGDLVAGDGIFTLEQRAEEPGVFRWQVVNCANESERYPAAAAWVRVAAAAQVVTLIFDSNLRDDPLFYDVPYVVTADDSTLDYRVVGSFQGWDAADPSGRLQPLGNGLYQQVRRIARPGEYEAYVIGQETEQAIDAYGRTTEPVPFGFTTQARGDFVVFLLDTNRGRASILYDMPPLLTRLAYRDGYRLIALATALTGLVFLIWMAARMAAMRNQANWLEAGCPNCGEHELVRVPRHAGDRLRSFFGLPAYRYQCRHCTWEGIRLSRDGALLSAPVAAVEARPQP